MSVLRKNSTRVGPGYPQVVVLVGATGDLSRRKLLTGLFHLTNAGFIPGCRIIGVSLDDIDADAFRTIARDSLDKFLTRKFSQSEWEAFAASLDYVPPQQAPMLSRKRSTGPRKHSAPRRGASIIYPCHQVPPFWPCNSLPRLS